MKKELYHSLNSYHGIQVIENMKFYWLKWVRNVNERASPLLKLVI